METLPQLILRLWRNINSRRRLQFALLSVLMVLASFAEVISIGAVMPFLGVLTSPEQVFQHELAQPMVHALGLNEASQLLLPVTFVFVLGALFSGTMRLLLLWSQTRLSHAIGADLSFSIYRRTLYQPYEVHLTRNSSDVISGISTKTTIVVHQSIMPILSIVSAIIMMLSILTALIAIQPTIAISAFVGFGFIYLLIILVTKKRLARYSESVSRENSQVIKALQEGLGGIRDVLIDGTQETYCKIYRSADLPLRRAIANIEIIGSSPRYGIEALGMALIAALAFSMTKESVGVASAIPVLGALALGAQRLLPVLQLGYQSWSNIRAGESSLRDTLHLLDQPLPDYADGKLGHSLVFHHEIALKNVEFSYSSESPLVLAGLDLVFPKGSRTGIIGTTGSGKSTLLDIVMGLLQPTNGTLAIDGVLVTLQNQRSWQTHVAHVPQAIFLTDTTIAENIAFGIVRDEIDYERVRIAAKSAQIAADIEGWPQQYGTIVGERGVRLSGGQRQRIGIARALYKQADVIVFDEATSALDSNTEYDVMKAIENLGEELTLVIVAHRLTTLRNCTQVVELADGRIKRIGAYQEMVGEGKAV
ncbi:ABC transporter ATP-binding protein/permease [Pseudomonadales bacterium]|nr:ABC transporter ATP-binding protein/permease [Pseudomonadales bacterium]